MLDFLYLAATVAFFALMLAYVQGCAALGRTGGAPSTDGTPNGARNGAPDET